MAIKYIVDISSEQTINGNVVIDGDLRITGSTTTAFPKYRALLTQTGAVTGTSIGTFNNQLIIGETYTINTYATGDDFSNIANVTSGSINQTGCVFIATGGVPTDWFNGSSLSSNGGLVVNVIENTLGYNLSWEAAPFGGAGYYIAVNDLFGPVNNSFPVTKTQVMSQIKYPFDGFQNFTLIAGVGNGPSGLNNVIYVDAYDWDLQATSNDLLYNTPVEITIDQDMTPFVVNGPVVPSYPFSYVSVRLYVNGSSVDVWYGLDNSQVSNISQVISRLNSQPETSVLGEFSLGLGGTIDLTMTTFNAGLIGTVGVDEITLEIFAD